MLANRRPPTILIVEDDQRLARVLSRVLSLSGYRVEWAAGLAAASRDFDPVPAVALLDFHLPDGNGIDLAAALRARYPDLPLILMTGCPFCVRERPDGTECFHRVLQKPLDLPQLREAISAAMNEVNHANDRAKCSR
jgi:DNA-binding response OmpR family regulator